MIGILTTYKDHSFINSFSQDSDFRITYYEDLHRISKNPENIDWSKIFDFKDKILLRDPYNTGNNYDRYLKYLLLHYQKNILLDYKTMRTYPQYEDKLFQQILLEKNNILCPIMFDPLLIKDYPVIVKKRISSRSKGNFIINSKEKLIEFNKNNNIKDYIIQELIKFKHDIRVLVLFKKIIGSVERNAIKRDDNTMSIKMKATFPLNKDQEKLVMEIAKIWEADFLGIDLLIDHHGNTYVIEVNLSPQYSSFERITGYEVAKLLRQRIIS